MSSNSTKPKHPSSKLDLTRIILALIGVLGTITVSYFAYLQATEPMDIELTKIVVTQTAAFEGTRAALLALATPLITSNSTPMTQTIFNTSSAGNTSLSTSTPIPTATPTLLPTDTSTQTPTNTPPFTTAMFTDDFEVNLIGWEGSSITPTINAVLVSSDYDNSKFAVEVTSDAPRNSDIHRLIPENFLANHSYRASVWCKAEAYVECRLAFGDLVSSSKLSCSKSSELFCTLRLCSSIAYPHCRPRFHPDLICIGENERFLAYNLLM